MKRDEYARNSAPRENQKDRNLGRRLSEGVLWPTSLEESHLHETSRPVLEEKNADEKKVLQNQSPEREEISESITRGAVVHLKRLQRPD